MDCINKCGFYGNKSKQGYCSICIADKIVMSVKQRCKVCNKKLGISGISCSCNFIFCGKHRYPFEHNCSVDHKKKHKKLLKESNVIVKRRQLEQI